MKKQLLAWIDCETTGLTNLHEKGAYTHKLLEIAVVVTTKDLKIVDEFNVVVGHDKAEAQALADNFVINIHTKNGLWDECAQSLTTIDQAQEGILQFLKKNGIEKNETALWGNGVYLDRVFIEAQMPMLSAHLNYRNGDISAVKEFLKLTSTEFEPVKVQSHRAMGDIKESVAEAKVYMDLLRPILERGL